ncbi:MAG: DUF5666 domain-containing protein [Variovorax sp.]
MINTLLRNALLALFAALLLSCGGGGGVGVGVGVGVGGGSGAAFGGPGPAALVDAGDSLLGGDGSSAGGGGPGGGGPGSAGTGADGGTATASNGDGSGVGSGGTGVSTADAAGIGSVDGAGSIFVNGLRYATDGVVLDIEDAPTLQLGMSLKVTGPVDADFTSGIARRIDYAADLRGPVSSVGPGQGSFVVRGTTVTTDPSTVWANLSGLGAVTAGMTLQVWGLPAAGRVAGHAGRTARPVEPILTGAVRTRCGEAHPTSAPWSWTTPRPCCPPTCKRSRWRTAPSCGCVPLARWPVCCLRRASNAGIRCRRRAARPCSWRA